MLNDATGFKHAYVPTGLCSYYFYPHLFQKTSIYLSLSQKDEDNIFHLKPQIRAISASSSGHNGFSSVDRLPFSIALRIISTEGIA